jgi:hypothetical protein
MAGLTNLGAFGSAVGVSNSIWDRPGPLSAVEVLILLVRGLSNKQIAERPP